MTREDQLAELLERWEETLPNGRATTLEDLCRDCPDLADEFRRLLANLGAVDAILAGDGCTLSLEELTARIDAGRYRPMSLHAQGGLGMVFIAEDGELRRNVALKCLQDLAATDDEARRRFLREAEITSKLEHPGVVPVYGFGRDATGKPYYAMRFIHGDTLADALDRFHDGTAHLDKGERNFELQRLLRRFVAVCETMAYAHARDVVHRDLKPSNIMLGSYGETLIVDWGLARRLDTPEEEPGDPLLEPLQLRLEDDSGGLTLPGQLRGSPVYMSPEQARGDWANVGPASDVYSLGATLYVLLTGKKPYEGRTSMDIVEKVKKGVFLKPHAVNGNVPKALEAICCKAMAFEPAQRYAGAAELARDLERWLADEPVSAWTEPILLTARRWLRRHQTMATTTAASFLVAFVVLGVAGVRLDQKNRRLEQAKAEVEELNKSLSGDNKDLLQAKAKLEKLTNTLNERSLALERENSALRNRNAP